MLKQGMKPTHPGQVLKNLYMDPLELSQANAAENLGITRKTLSMLLNGHQGISAEMALRLAKAFDTTPELWLNMQRNYDLWNAGQKVKLSQVKIFRRARTLAAETVVLKGKTLQIN
jgi:addiction module HigA family antidote